MMPLTWPRRIASLLALGLLLASSPLHGLPGEQESKADQITLSYPGELTLLPAVKPRDINHATGGAERFFFIENEKEERETAPDKSDSVPMLAQAEFFNPASLLCLGKSTARSKICRRSTDKLLYSGLAPPYGSVG